MDVVADNFGSFFRNMVEEGVEVERARLSEGS
jgi:hypothetical protein